MLVSDFCKTGAGGTPLKSKNEYYDGGNIPWLLSGEVGKKKYIYESKNFITELGLDNSSAKVFPKDSVLIAMYGATAGEVGILKVNAATNQAVCAIYPNEKVIPEYLYYFFTIHKDKLVAQAVGNAQPNISQAKIKNTFVPLPSVEEQKKIVAILDQAFAEIDKARTNAEQNLKNARELFDSYLNQVFSQRGEGWEEKKLAELAEVKYGYTEKANFEKVGPHFLRITDIQNNNVNWPEVPYCVIEDADFDKHRLQSGDIVFARTGATTGKSYLIIDPPLSVPASYLIRLRLVKDGITPSFVSYYFKTKSYWDEIGEGISGSAQGGFNATKLGELIIRYPKSTAIQENLVNTLRKLEHEVIKLEKLSHFKLRKLEELKKSILQKAFSGELT